MPNFSRFVSETGYLAFAEIAPDPNDYPGMLPELAFACSLVFEQPSGPVDISSLCWWEFQSGANWCAPLGTGRSIMGIEDHPVVHITHADAAAYAAWSGKRLPTEVELEFAARGGLKGAEYAWGDALISPRAQTSSNASRRRMAATFL